MGVEALPFQVDLRDDKKIEACVEAVVAKFGRVDILINNASALWWQDIVDTPARKYDLITSINARGTFLMTRACLPHMERNDFGRVITMSPPISNGVGAFQGRTAYNISKMGMVSRVVSCCCLLFAVHSFVFFFHVCFSPFFQHYFSLVCPDDGCHGCCRRIRRTKHQWQCVVAGDSH